VSNIRINLKKQSQFAGLCPEIRSTKFEIRNDLKKQSQSPAFGRKFEARNTKFETKAFFRIRFEKTKPILKS